MKPRYITLEDQLDAANEQIKLLRQSLEDERAKTSRANRDVLDAKKETVLVRRELFASKERVRELEQVLAEARSARAAAMEKLPDARMELEAQS